MESAIEFSDFINFWEEETEGGEHMKASECGVDKELGSEKDFIFFLKIQGEKLRGLIPDTIKKTAIRRLLCWMGQEQIYDSRGLVRKKNFYISSGIRDLSLYLPLPNGPKAAHASFLIRIFNLYLI